MRILVVDDDPMNRKYLRALLTHEGHAVFECEDGLAALDRLKIELCDAIISDVLMPRMDGYRLCHEIRNNKILAAIPVILFSATYLSTADEKAALAMGADKFLRKPALPEAVVAALDEVAGTAQRRHATQSKKIEDLSALREYSEVLVRKLEETNMQLAAANNALRESEERLRLAATAGNIGMWEWTPATDNLVWSDQQKLILGSPPDAAALKLDGFLNAIVAEDRPQVQAALQNVVANRADYEIEYRVRWPDKSVHWISSKGRGEYDEGGRCTRVVGVALDMTRRKEADELRQRHLERVRALNEISFAVTSTMNRQSQLEVLLEKIETFFPYPTVSTLRLFHRETGRLESLAERGGLDPNTWRARETERTLHRALKVVDTKAPVIIADIHHDAVNRNRPMPSNFGLVSYAGVPLVARDAVLGVLGVYTKEYHEFNAEEVEFLTTLAGQAAIAIQNAQLFEEVDRARKDLESTNRSLETSLKQLDSFYTTLAPIGTAVSPQDLVGGIIDRVMEATGADAGLVRIGDRIDHLPIVGHRGFSAEYLAAVETPPSDGAVAWVFEHGKPIIAPDIATEPRFKAKGHLRQGLRSCAVLPLHIHGAVRGILHIAACAADYFNEPQQNHLSAIARQMSIALENRELFDHVRASRDELAQANAALQETNRMLVALHAVAAAASQSTDLDRVLERAIEAITGVFDFEAVRIHLYDEKNDEIVRRAAFEKHPERFAGTLSFKKGQGIVGKVIEFGTRFIFDDITTDPRYLQLSRTHIASRFDHRFFAVFPIRTKTRIFGALGCLGSAARRLTDAEIQLLEALTDQLAVAIENNRLYEDISLKVAELQRRTTELEQANKVKDEFLGVVSHELRTPINVILGYTALFTDGTFGEIKPAQQEALAKIGRESKALLAMINSILSATTMESEPLVIEVQEFHAEHLLAELEANYSVTVPHHLAVHWDYPTNLPLLKTDRRKLRQILDNIIGNAAKFTEQGMIIITVRAAGSPERTSPRGSKFAPPTPGRSWLEFKVRDTGVGIPQRALSKVFDKFYQADSSETRSYGGVGMGLYIARRLTLLIGGTIAVESTEGKGSTFTVTMPCGQ